MFFYDLPVRLDLFAVFILVGFVQGVSLSVFFLVYRHKKRLANQFLGCLMLSLSLCIADVWLGYTNLMPHAIWLNNSTEPLNLLFGPFTFLYVKLSLSQRFERKDYLHFLPAVVFFLYLCLMYFPQSIEFKYNDFLESFHPELPQLKEQYYGARWMFWLKGQVNNLTFMSLLLYQIAATYLIGNALQERNLTFFSKQNQQLAWLRDLVVQFGTVLLVFMVIRLSFRHDLGDHLIAAHISLVIYITSFRLLSGSLFLKEIDTKPLKKYENSSLSTEIEVNTLHKIEHLMQSQKPYLDASFSLPEFAKMLSVSTHHLSQILNEKLKKNFFDFVASYRIQEAKQLLKADGNKHLKIEEIAEMVGYNSKSAFNTAFKKIVGQTPSAFRDS